MAVAAAAVERNEWSGRWVVCVCVFFSLVGVAIPGICSRCSLIDRLRLIWWLPAPPAASQAKIKGAVRLKVAWMFVLAS